MRVNLLMIIQYAIPELNQFFAPGNSLKRNKKKYFSQTQENKNNCRFFYLNNF